MIYLILILYSYPIPKLKSSILIFHHQICLLKYYSIKNGTFYVSFEASCLNSA